MQGRTLDATPDRFCHKEDIYDAGALYRRGYRLKLSLPCVIYDALEQPGLSISIKWNDLRKSWTPFLVVAAGRYGIQFGWLWDREIENG